MCRPNSTDPTYSHCGATALSSTSRGSQCADQPVHTQPTAIAVLQHYPQPVNHQVLSNKQLKHTNCVCRGTNCCPCCKTRNVLARTYQTSKDNIHIIQHKLQSVPRSEHSVWVTTGRLMSYSEIIAVRTHCSRVVYIFCC